MSIDTADKNLDLYRAYLHDILYDPKHAGIDLCGLSDDEQRCFAETLMQFGSMVLETREFAQSLAQGDLDNGQPAADNELAAPLISLHAMLKRLTWQAKQIAGGDYDQRIDFMGEFSDAINDMIAQLAERRNEAEAEAERNKAHLAELARANSIFETITSNMEEWIVMLDRTTGEHLFANHTAESMLISESFEKQLYGILYEYTASMGDNDEPKKEEFSLVSDVAVHHFEMMLYPVLWFDRHAVACVLTDVTATREEYIRLEGVVYKDALTGVYNRLYGMKLLEQYVNEGLPFELVFVDMDMLKYVNDVFGHAEGDVYIKNVADILQESFGRSVVCRLGGDEFMVLIKESDAGERDMGEVFETLRAKLINGTSPDTGGKHPYHRSISFGIAKIGPDNTLTTRDILTIADERMYEYKKAHKQERRI